jgi:hypothetical protein
MPSNYTWLAKTIINQACRQLFIILLTRLEAFDFQRFHIFISREYPGSK